MDAIDHLFTQAMPEKEAIRFSHLREESKAEKKGKKGLFVNH
jgi:hypothetical protein